MTLKSSKVAKKDSSTAEVRTLRTMDCLAEHEGEMASISAWGSSFERQLLFSMPALNCWLAQMKQSIRSLLKMVE